jgi:drug/metabolite transporter (DMT)-like permease
LSRSYLVLCTALAMLAFAANSILCRLALREGAIDAASFTAIRVASGALALWVIVVCRRVRAAGGPRFALPVDVRSAFALFAYAIGFSFAYLSLTAGTGALLLFGAVQATMLVASVVRGEQLSARQGFGLVIALGGLAYLLWPGVAAPPVLGGALMLAAGAAWGVYSLRGRGSRAPLEETAGNFLLAVPLALGTLVAFLPTEPPAAAGVVYAVLSGALASGFGYAIWYTALPRLGAVRAASVQLSVPVIAAAAGVLLLGEALTPRLVFASVAVLGGIWLTVAVKAVRVAAD